MSIPNIITFLRIVAVPAAMYMIFVGRMDWAFGLFCAAGLSDALDGAIARMCRARTVLGGYLDPLADKALIVGVYVALAWVGQLPLWLAMMVVFRDLMIIGGVILLFTLKEAVAMQPLYVSKVNTVVQIALAAVVLAPPALGLPDLRLFDQDPAELLVYACAATTLLSGLLYARRGALLFDRLGGVP